MTDDPIRGARLDSLGILLTRIANGRTLTPDEARLLTDHIDTEVRENTIARALARNAQSSTPAPKVGRVQGVLNALAAQPVSTAPLAAGLPLVRGNCPACGRASLFLGAGGHVTCSIIDCPNPSAADEQLHGEQPVKAATEPVPCPACARADQAGLAADELHPDCRTKEQHR